MSRFLFVAFLLLAPLLWVLDATVPAALAVTQIAPCSDQGLGAGCVTPLVIQRSICDNNPGLCQPQTANVVYVACGATLSSVISGSSPTGTVYQLAGNATTPCTYSGQTFSTNTNITVQGDCSSPVGANTILDGGNGALTATDGRADAKTGVTIKCLTVQHYRTHTADCQTEAIGTYDGWVVRNNSFISNGCFGMFVNGNALVMNNLISGNGTEGIFDMPGFSLQARSLAASTIEGNEIASNGNTDSYGNTSAGIKVVPYNGTAVCPSTGALPVQGTRILNNYVHDNIGSGIWTDCWSTNTVITGNTVTRNSGNGIHVEISVGILVTSNVMYDNDFADTTSARFPTACLYVNSSANVDVYNNYCAVNPTYGNSILVEATCRADSPPAALIGNLKNVWVHHNTIAIPVVSTSPVFGESGSTDDSTASGSTSYGALCSGDTHPANAAWTRFSDNVYFLPAVTSTPFTAASCGFFPNFAISSIQAATGNACLTGPNTPNELGSTVIAAPTSMNAIGGCTLSAVTGQFCTGSGL